MQGLLELELATERKLRDLRNTQHAEAGKTKRAGASILLRQRVVVFSFYTPERK